MNTAACIELGIIQRKQGLKGDVMVQLHQDVAGLDALKTLFIQIDHTLVPYGIEYLLPKDYKAVVKLQGIDDAKTAHDLKGLSIFVPQEALPQEATQALQLTKLMGYHVTDAQEGDIGFVQDIYTSPQQKLLAIDYQGQELLIPYHSDLVTHVDHEQRTIATQLPKGFIEAMY